MKTFKVIFALLFIVLFLEGCKNDDPAPVIDQSAELIGTWEAVSFVASGCIDPADNEHTTCNSDCEILVITSTTIAFDGEGPYTYTTAPGNSMTINFNGDKITGHYSISGETLAFTQEDSPSDGGCKNVSTYKKYDNKVSDIDGNVYNTIFIGTQEWMKENLKTKHYNDGSAIPNVTQASDWINLFSGAYSDYDNAASNVSTYGRLYNSYAVSDSRNVCPNGWHVPSLDEWGVLIGTLGGESIAGGKMKAPGTVQNSNGLWNSPNTGATNASGFTGLPGGTRFDAGDFRDVNNFAHWKTSDGWTIRVQAGDAIVEMFNNFPTNGSSVRCVKD